MNRGESRRENFRCSESFSVFVDTLQVLIGISMIFISLFPVIARLLLLISSSCMKPNNMRFSNMFSSIMVFQSKNAISHNYLKCIKCSEVIR